MVHQAQARYRPRRQGLAFTLIEMLVCVAIIVIVLSITLASLAEARESARAAVCGTHQGQLGRRTVNFSADNKGHLPWVAWQTECYDQGVLICPTDERPQVIPAQVMFKQPATDLLTSLGFNPEYAWLGVKLSTLKDVSNKVLSYDGYGGDGFSGNNGNGNGGSFTGDFYIDGDKAVITHLPPGNTGNPSIISIGQPALQAHIDHGDLAGQWLINGQFDFAGVSQGLFNRRHHGQRDGNILFVDGHVRTGTALTNDMFLYPSGTTTTTTGGGDTGGNGNSGGNNGKGGGKK